MRGSIPALLLYLLCYTLVMDNDHKHRLLAKLRDLYFQRAGVRYTIVQMSEESGSVDENGQCITSNPEIKAMFFYWQQCIDKTMFTIKKLIPFAAKDETLRERLQRLAVAMMEQKEFIDETILTGVMASPPSTDTLN
jgi:hypothetical protein